MAESSEIPEILASATDGPLPTCVARLLVVASSAETTATRVAEATGLSSRFALARRLRKSRSITYGTLCQWITVDRVLRQWESTGLSPCNLLLGTGRDPAWFYHLVRRLTGRPWLEVKELGSAWLMARFAERCRERREELKRATSA